MEENLFSLCLFYLCVQLLDGVSVVLCITTPIATHFSFEAVNRLTKTFTDVATAVIDLHNVSVAILQNIVGLKTARFFLMHSRQGFRCATLDTHILAWLNTQGVEAPKATPSNLNKYLSLEAKYLSICDERGLDPAALDLEIWKSRQVSVAAKEISAVA